MQKKKELPFDEKNKADFASVTAKIKAALSKIENDLALPASGEKLAELAGCGRKTLYNRKWPIEKLDEIKAARKTLKIEQIKKRNNYEDAEAGRSNEEKFVILIDNLQKENGELFDRVQHLEEKLKISLDASTALNREVQVLRQANSDLKLESRKHTNASNIIDINFKKNQ